MNNFIGGKYMKRTLEVITKETEQIKFKVHQCTEQLKVLREKRNEVEVRQGNENMSTPIEETVARVQELKSINEKISQVEIEMNGYLDEQELLDQEIISIINDMKNQRNEALEKFEQEYKEVLELSKELQVKVNKLAEQRSQISLKGNQIQNIAQRYLNNTKAKQVLYGEPETNYTKQVNQIRSLLVKQAGKGIGAIS